MLWLLFLLTIRYGLNPVLYLLNARLPWVEAIKGFQRTVKLYHAVRKLININLTTPTNDATCDNSISMGVTVQK